MNSKTDFLDYLKFTNSQKEVSLAIAKDDTELRELKEILESKNYKQATEVSQLMLYIDSPCKLYFVVFDQIPKDLYDFIVQYPTGQVEIFDGEKMKSQVATPSYHDVSIIILLTIETLSKIQKENFSILENVGITYQS